VNTGPDPAQVLATIPGWQGASYRELPGGLTNRTLLVEKAGRRAVLKIDPAPRMPPYNPRREEARIQDRAAALGRANGVLYVHETVLLAEWSEGEVWTRAHFELDAATLVAAESRLALIDSMPGPMNLCCCHNDLVAENIIATPQVRFLDWEYACDNDPLFDLAIVVAHHDLSDRHADVLLDAYFDGAGRRWREQFATQMRLYDALNWLWSAANAPPAQDE
jgi:thiamine kinase-like enzyme